MFLDCPAKLVHSNSKGNIVLSCVDREGKWYKIVLSPEKASLLVGRMISALDESSRKEVEK